MSAASRFSRGGLRWAVPSEYLDRLSATVLVFVKLLDALSTMAGFAIGIVVTVALVRAMNSVIVSGVSFPALLMEWLRQSGVSQENLLHVSQMLSPWSDLHVSGATLVTALLASLPGVVVSCLEAVALIRVRIGMRGAKAVSVLHRLHFVFGVIEIVGIVIMSLALILAATQLMDGMGLMVATIASAFPMVLVRLPHLFYHNDISWAMGEVDHELSTGRRAVITKTRLDSICNFYIVVEALRTVGAIAASLVVLFAAPDLPASVVGAPASGLVAALPVTVALASLLKVVRYVCVKDCYRNFVHAGDAEARDEADLSGSTIVSGCGVVAGLFTILTIVVCIGIGGVSDGLSQRAREFFEHAHETAGGSEYEMVALADETAVHPDTGDAQQVPDATAVRPEATGQGP